MMPDRWQFDEAEHDHDTHAHATPVDPGAPAQPGWDGPRYSTRPLPEYRFLPGRDPHPTADPRGHSVGNAPWFEIQACDPDAWRECQPYLYGVDCFNHGYWWEAHEAWEPLWRGLDSESIQAHYIQGLIQAANALLKRRMGWRSATAKLRAETLRHLERVPDHDYMGLAVGAWRRSLDRCLRPGGVGYQRLALKER